MSDSSTTPVVILAFANDQDAYLQMIVKERKGIAKALQEHDDRRYLKVVKEENTSIKDVFDLCTRYADRVAIFHYGGHASGTQLQLEAGAGIAEMANASGLAQLLGQQQGLQLVFLNGCATLDQVQTLFACGVKAVIATAVPINDAAATDFSEQFYLALGSGATIDKAFQSAKALVATRYGTAREVGEFRAVNWGAKRDAAAAAVAAMPWGLYVNTQARGEAVLAWTLPRAAEHQVIIRGSTPAANAGAAVNTGLIETLFNAVAKQSPAVGVLWEAAKKSKRQDLRMVRQQIIDSFPAPIGEQLRKLFAANTIDVQRLRQLVLTYETIAELFCFTVLSQLWNARHDAPTLALSADDVALVDGFLGLSKEEQTRYDYVALITTVARIFRDNAIDPFIDEFADLGQSGQGEAFESAHRFMEEMRAELVGGPVAAEEITSFCVQAERHLGTILSHFAFLVRYRLATIKKIDIIKSRHKAPEYRFNQVVLDRVTAGIMDSEEVYTAFTDSESVILLKGDDMTTYLSLSPFVIDENAFTGDQNSKLFFYSHRDDDGRSYAFRFVENEDDGLVISDEKYPQVKQQFEEFAQAVRPA
ncbi:MAG: CHAT domain-containing protein [Acidobacteriota bacterium]